MLKKLSIFTFIFVICDQLLKILVVHNIDLYQYIEIIKNFFGITHVHNTGGAFSILSDNIPLLIGVAIIALILIYYLLIRNRTLSTLDIIVYSLLIGGIIGNLVDRIFNGYVIDYITIKIFSYDFPIFNLADVGIVISVLLIMLQSIKEEVCKKSK